MKIEHYLWMVLLIPSVSVTEFLGKQLKEL